MLPVTRTLAGARLASLAAGPLADRTCLAAGRAASWGSHSARGMVAAGRGEAWLLHGGGALSKTFCKILKIDETGLEENLDSTHKHGEGCEEERS